MQPRTLSAVVLAALVAAPSAAVAQTRRASNAPAAAAPALGAGLAVGGMLGWEWGEGDLSGFQLRADGELPFRQLTPEVKMSLLGSVGFTRSTQGYGGIDLTVSRLKLVPAARFSLPVNPQLTLFADGGIGLHYTRVSWDYGPLGDASDSGIGLLLRIGGGAAYHVNPRLRVLGEVVFDPTFGDYDENSIALLVGLLYQL